jgi:hypothetical protein
MVELMTVKLRPPIPRAFAGKITAKKAALSGPRREKQPKSRRPVAAVRVGTKRRAICCDSLTQALAVDSRGRRPSGRASGEPFEQAPSLFDKDAIETQLQQLRRELSAAILKATITIHT